MSSVEVSLLCTAPLLSWPLVVETRGRARDVGDDTRRLIRHLCQPGKPGSLILETLKVTRQQKGARTMAAALSMTVG